MSPRPLDAAVSHSPRPALASGHFRSFLGAVHPSGRRSRIPACRAACRLSDGGNAMTKTSRSVTVGVIVTVGLAGIGWTALGDGSRRCCRRSDDNRVGGAGLESDLHRHAHRHEHGELLQSAARGDRSHGDLRRLQRHRTALHADLRPRQAPRGASRRAAVIAAAYTALVGLFPSRTGGARGHYAASLAALSDDCEAAPIARTRLVLTRSSAASHGAPRWRRPCWPGARTTGSAGAIRRSPAAPRLASGGRRRRRSPMSAQGLAFT